MNEQGHVLVIGGANMDIIGQPGELLAAGTSSPGRIHTSLGGVARNIAANLAQLEVDTVLLTAVGDDETGASLLGRAAGRGIDISEAAVIEGVPSGAYIGLLAADGSLHYAIDDMAIMEYLTPAYFEAHAALFENARMVVMDANPLPEAIETIVSLCTRYNVPLCADPTSSSLASKLRPYLNTIHMISPNVRETAALCDHQLEEHETEAARKAARALVSLGVDLAVLTLGEHGVVYADVETAGYIPAVKTEIVDLTGAGDAMSAAIIFGLLEGIPVDECVRLGVTAASLTLRTRETVRSDLNVDLLYDELVI